MQVDGSRTLGRQGDDLGQGLRQEALDGAMTINILIPSIPSLSSFISVTFGRVDYLLRRSFCSGPG